MKVHCSCPTDLATSTLTQNLIAMGLNPIVTSHEISVDYEGNDHGLGEAIVELYSHEADHHIVVHNYKNTPH